LKSSVRNPASAPPPRLDVIVARAAPKAVVFRRGPSRYVQLWLWDLETDKLDPGQWFRGRIYSRRADLSPDGQFLDYYAASHRPPFYCWTAISRPPWLTALALWPKGDCWGGGALFESPSLIKLNHRFFPSAKLPKPNETTLAEEFSLPPSWRVEPLHEGAGRGEDDPIHYMRLERDGWTWEEIESVWSEDRNGPIEMRYDPPITRRRMLPSMPGSDPVELRVKNHGNYEKQGRWYVETADLVGVDGRVVHDLGRVDFAEVDHDRGVIFGFDGRIERLVHRAPARQGESAFERRFVCDLTDSVYSRRTSPPEARSW
jgi:hypothetical protein